MAINDNPKLLLDTKAKKLSFLKNLILIATADRDFDTKEGDFLLEMARNLDLTYDDVKPLAENMNDAEFVVPESDEAKAFELQAMVMMMLQDDSIEDTEYNLCLQYAERVGLNKYVLDDLIYKLTA